MNEGSQNDGSGYVGSFCSRLPNFLESACKAFVIRMLFKYVTGVIGWVWAFKLWVFDWLLYQIWETHRGRSQLPQMALSKYLFNSLTQQKLTEHSSWPGEYFLLLLLFSFLWSLLCDLPSLKVNQPQSGCFFKLETCMCIILGNQLCLDNFNVCLGSLFLLATVFRMELER